jgi:hypothetical protein
MMVGRFEANLGNDTESIDLGPDGTYLYYYKGGDGKVLTNANKWKFECLDGKPRIIFLGFVFALPGYSPPNASGWYYDSESGLHYTYPRYYDLRRRGYLTPGPGYSIQPEGTGIPYLDPFLLNNPEELKVFSYVVNDPRGLETFKCEEYEPCVETPHVTH